MVGRYVFTEDTVSIFPIKATVPFGIVDNRTNKALECNNFSVSLYSISEDRVIGTVEYEKFIHALNKDKVSAYDSGNLLIGAVSLDEMKKILEAD